jgi:thiamine kinase-like enzyme
MPRSTIELPNIRVRNEEIPQKRMILTSLEQKIVEYLQDISPEILGLSQCRNIKILTMTPGSYNLNYHVEVEGVRFIFRVNVRAQSGLSNQIDYEFKVMKFLEPYQITAKVFHFDNSKSHFDFDVMIEECLEGSWLSLSEEDMPAAAELLARLHSVDPSPLSIITWSDPLMDTVKLLQLDMTEYRPKKSADKKVISLTEKFFKIMNPRIEKKRNIFKPDGINHTDVAIDNFVKTKQGLRLIDWEKPRLDDSSYDICCFLAKPAQLWCTPKVLSDKGREIFFNKYIEYSGKDGSLMTEKVAVREPLSALHWIFWGMNRMCDLKDQTTASALQQVHEERVARWERIADPLLIEQLIEEL